MSVLLMGRVWGLAEVTRSERDVLLALADHAHDDGTSARPGVPYLVWKLGLAKDTIHTALRGLEEKRLIIPTAKGGGRGNVTEYRLALENGTKKRPFREDGNGRIQPRNGRKCPPETVGNGLARVDEPSVTLEPSEPSTPARVTAAWRSCSPPLIDHGDRYFAAHRSAVVSALKVYSAADVAKAIENYARVLASPAHYWSHSWTLVDFLKRGLDRFVEEARPLENFQTAQTAPGRTDAGDMLRRAAAEREQERREEQRG